MSDPLYPPSSAESAEHRRSLAPETEKAFQAFQAFSRQVFADGALPAKVKQIIAVAVAHVTQCPYCIRGHTKSALRHGATQQELMEAIWVAAEMRAGGAFAHSTVALAAMAEGEHSERRTP
ncbi:MAG TPA: carboxymuconolactone decarboxylase family protein [Steroidobacteraceae bacterium]|nr:carboxymuconolactone decarboxylase family protein [Steroidobacteraceae bacterium]